MLSNQTGSNCNIELDSQHAAFRVAMSISVSESCREHSAESPGAVRQSLKGGMSIAGVCRRG